MSTTLFLENLKDQIEEQRNTIIQHPVYHEMKSIDDIRIFMEHHIYAVWDFMSLLKSLQNKLTCTSAPWFPVGSANTRFLINEIVVGEESDVDPDGNRLSHFELYLKAMNQAGANTEPIQAFIESLKLDGDLESAFQKANVPLAARDFVRQTFKIIHEGKTHAMAATFTFGREDLIPNMFIALIADQESQFPGNLSLFKYYLERHIEVDGDHHSHLAIDMTCQLCCTDSTYWKAATESTVAALESRIGLWNGVYNTILQNR